MSINSTTSLSELLEHAKQSLKDVRREDGEFVVKDLFRGFEWNRIGRGDRTKLGSMFLSYVQHEGASFIEPTGKTPQNQQKYRLK